MNKSILIVDDERLLARTLSQALRDAGYETATATTAEQAERQIFSGREFDLVVLDNRLPRASGLGILEQMREKKIPGRVILMTAFGSPEVRAQARRLQVDRYISKPFDLARMIEEIDDLVGHASEGSSKGNS